MPPLASQRPLRANVWYAAEPSGGHRLEDGVLYHLIGIAEPTCFGEACGVSYALVGESFSLQQNVGVTLRSVSSTLPGRINPQSALEAICRTCAPELVQDSKSTSNQSAKPSSAEDLRRTPALIEHTVKTL